jgi:hypothetical protein
MKLHSYKKYPEFIAKPARAREGFLMEMAAHESDQNKQQNTPCLRSEECGHVEYACICLEGKCFSCGCKLDKEEIEAGREQCFDCYCIDQD